MLTLTGTQRIDDGVGPSMASLEISSVVTTDPYASISINNIGDDANTTYRAGIDINVTGGTEQNIGVNINVSPELGNNAGVYVVNGSNPQTPKTVEYGGVFFVIGGIPTNDGEKYGLYTAVAKGARYNYGIFTDVASASESNYGGYFKVSGAAGSSNYGIYVNNDAGNTGATGNEYQYGAYINVTGDGATGNTYKFGAYINITGAARDNRGLVINATGATLNNDAIVTQSGSVIINDNGDPNSDFRVEGDTDVNLFSTDASADKVGVGVSGPTQKLDVRGSFQTVHDPNTWLSSAGGYGDIVLFGTGTGLTAGRVYYLNTSLVWTPADADAAADATGMLAIALGTAVSDGMLVRGYARNTGYTFTDGQILYLSISSGTFTATAPSGAGDIVRICGYQISAANDIIYFNPSNDWVEI